MALKMFRIAPRGSGKTTLALELAEQFPGALFVNGYRHYHIFNVKSTKKETIIIDEAFNLGEESWRNIQRTMHIHDYYLIGTPMKPLKHIIPKGFLKYIKTMYPEFFI